VKFCDLCSKIKQADIDILAAFEHNLNTNKFLVRQLLQQMATHSFKHHTLKTAISSIPVDKFYKPGGTMLLARGNIVGQIKECSSNPAGCWSWIKLIG
jgi:hypothetical protein